MYEMFNACVQPRHWKLEIRRDEEDGSYVYAASAFNQDIGRWNTTQVTEIVQMFKLAAVFNQNLNGTLWKLH